MSGALRHRRALLITVVLLVAAAAALGASAALGWALAGFEVPLRGIIEVRVLGADVLPALAPLALLALAAVAAVLATGGWLRRLFGAVLLLATVPLGRGVARAADQDRLVDVAAAAGQLPARSVPAGAVMVLPAGPGLATTGALLIAAAGAMLVWGGHRMPRMGRRYRAPARSEGTRRPESAAESGGLSDRELWERIDAGEDPTAPDDPR